jgi:hypothetical protein
LGSDPGGIDVGSVGDIGETVRSRDREQSGSDGHQRVGTDSCGVRAHLALESQGQTGASCEQQARYQS